MLWPTSATQCDPRNAAPLYVTQWDCQLAQLTQLQTNGWNARTLDDSAIRRIILPEGFLAVDVILTLRQNIGDGLHVWPNVVKAWLTLWQNCLHVDRSHSCGV